MWVKEKRVLLFTGERSNGQTVIPQNGPYPEMTTAHCNMAWYAANYFVNQQQLCALTRIIAITVRNIDEAISHIEAAMLNAALVEIPEKEYRDALQIIEKVIKFCPHAKIYACGNTQILPDSFSKKNVFLIPPDADKDQIVSEIRRGIGMSKLAKVTCLG